MCNCHPIPHNEGTEMPSSRLLVCMMMFHICIRMYYMLRIPNSIDTVRSLDSDLRVSCSQTFWCTLCYIPHICCPLHCHYLAQNFSHCFLPRSTWWVTHALLAEYMWRPIVPPAHSGHHRLCRIESFDIHSGSAILPQSVRCHHLLFVLQEP